MHLTVIAGLDPAIHVASSMDHRVKPGGDDRGAAVGRVGTATICEDFHVNLPHVFRGIALQPRNGEME